MYETIEVGTKWENLYYKNHTQQKESTTVVLLKKTQGDSIIHLVHDNQFLSQTTPVFEK